MAEGAGARFLDGMADPARDGDSPVFVDETWPIAFQERIGESILVRVSPDTGCDEFEDADGVVFWTVVPVAPLTWNWISPFRLPFRFDAQNLFSPFRLAREWLLTTPEIEAMRVVPMRRAPRRSAPAAPVTNLCFTAFAITNEILFFTADWPTDDVLPEAVIDVYCSTNELNRFPFLIYSHPATNPPVSFSFQQSLVPNYGISAAPIHTNGCELVTNIVVSPLDGTTVYTNVVWTCGHCPPNEAAFFRLGSRVDSDWDGLSDAFESYVTLTDPFDADSDDDGLSDGDEVFFGTNPFDSDTDDDGLQDGAELGVIRVRPASTEHWLNTVGWTKQVLNLSDPDDGCTNVVLPFSFAVCGASSNLSVNANGLVRFSDGFSSLGTGSYGNRGASQIPISSGEGVTVAAFWDDLQLYTNLASEVSLAVSGEGTDHVGVVEFSRVGFYGQPTNHLVSFQVQFRESEPSIVRVAVSESLGIGDGSSATLGARCKHGFMQYAMNESGSVHAGLCIEYRFGFWTDPSNSDTDGDGLSDSAEIQLGTNPGNIDTDGDGVSDGDEVFLGMNPLLKDTDNDGDGLPYWREVDELWTDPDEADTDGDGLDDGWEVSHGTDPTWRDTDGDGLWDGMELAIGTDPKKRDTDGDGLDDKWEWEHDGFNPLDPADAAADWDGDCLSNLQEKNAGTDPGNSDTDGDGISDGAEVAAGTSPVLSDTDGDGLSDAEESVAGTDPNQADTDGDGCPDVWEVLFGFDPLDDESPNVDADPDGDHLPNVREASLGTNPLSADTDGDGLSDADEVGWASVEMASPFDLTGATNLLDGISDLDGGSGRLQLPFPISVQNRSVCSNLAFSIDGYVSLTTSPQTGVSSGVSTSCPLSVWAFSDNLFAETNGMASRLAFAEVTQSGSCHAVLEYRNFIPYGLQANPTNAVSFQLDFAQDRPGEVRVIFFRADGDGTIPMPNRALGSSATIATKTESTEVEFSKRRPVATPGTAIRFRIGTGTDPLRPDTDSDGIEDEDELEGGTDPRSFDTDGDGMPDGWEDDNGLDPLDSSDGVLDPDEDGLSNEEEYLNGTDPHDPDTDDDGASDADEAAQGSDPNDPADCGLPPDSEDVAELPFHVYGDWAAWRMTVTGLCTDERTFRFHTDAPGDSESRTLRLIRGNAYRITLDWLGSGTHRNPYWYCWEAQFGDPLVPAGKCFNDYNPSRLPGNKWIRGEGWFADNRDGLLTSHVHMCDGEGGNVSEGREAILYIPKADLSIHRLGVSDPVPATLEETEGSIVRILDPNRGETPGSGRDRGLALRIDSVYSDAGLTNATAFLRLRKVTTDPCPGLVRLYRETQGGTLALLLSNSDAVPEAQIAWQPSADTLWIEFDRAGVIDVSLDIRMGATLVYRDTVRATGIPTDPNPGRILFVNPFTRPQSPYRDFRSGANSIEAALGVAWAGDNVVAAATGYREFGVPLISDVVLAGLGGRFSDNLANHPVGFDFTRTADVNVYGFASTFKGDGIAGTTVAGFRMRRFSPCDKSGGAFFLEDSDGVSLERIDFRGNAATEFGGAVCLSLSSNIVMTCCVASNNVVDYDDRGRIAYDRGMGGAVAVLESDLFITNCFFRSNVAQVTNGGSDPSPGSSGGGGDIFIRDGMVDCLSSKFSGSRAGAVKQPFLSSDIQPVNYFTGDGGAILVHGTQDNTRLRVVSSEFSEESSIGNGGAISCSRNADPVARTFFDSGVGLSWDLEWPWFLSAVKPRPEILGGGGTLFFDECTFDQCSGGWQGGAVSINGRDYFALFNGCRFLACVGGSVHLRDGKGGAIAVGGGLQRSYNPENHVVVSNCIMSGCSATGNGGALYVTIRGLLDVVDSEIMGCRALNSGTTFENDLRKVAGMGGAIHVSAGGFCRLSSTANGLVAMTNNTANTSGGALSVKSGRLYLDGDVLLSGNSANGEAIDGYGNGGALFVTSSLFDDMPPMGAGSAAALLYEEHGFLSRISGQLQVLGNSANRWGGALYAGISDPWIKQEIVENPSERCASHVSLTDAELEGNSAEKTVFPTLYVPAHVAFEYVNGPLSLSGSSIVGDGTNDIGVLEMGSSHANTNGMSFTNVLVPHYER